MTKSKPKQSDIDITTWRSAFEDLKNMDIHVIIECEDLKEPSFEIGPIEKVGKKSVSIRNYDRNGLLDKKATKIQFKDITLVKFNDQYSTTFKKYLTQK